MKQPSRAEVETGPHGTPERKVRVLRSVPTPAASPVAPVTLAKVLAREGDGYRVRIGGAERFAACDPTVDPALLEDAIVSGARVLVEAEPLPVIVGVVQTRRSLTVDRRGNLDADLKRFRINAQEVLLKTTDNFVRLSTDELELYGNRIATRAREVVRILGRMIKLN